MKLATQAERDRWLAFVAAQPLPLEVECKRWKKARTDPQNSMLFGVIYPPIAAAMGYEVDGDNGIHAFFCGTHFGWVDVTVPKTPRNPEGIASEPRRSTTRTGWNKGKRDVIKADEFGKFMEMVERIAAKAGVFVPMAAAA